MSIDAIKEQLPDTARDIRLNLGTVLTEAGAPGLSPTQIWGVALTSAISARNAGLAAEVEALARSQAGQETVDAAHAAASVMAMNNVYYRFAHLVSEPGYRTMPAKLRMNVIGRPGVPRADFELYSLVASAINGCGACMDSHEAALRKEGVPVEGIQSAIRIAAVIHAAAVALESAQVLQAAA